MGAVGAQYLNGSENILHWLCSNRRIIYHEVLIVKKLEVLCSKKCQNSIYIYIIFYKLIFFSFVDNLAIWLDEIIVMKEFDKIE